MFDFDRPIRENISGNPLVCAHRGVSGGNIACNTMAAFKCALTQGADMIELDITESNDHLLWVFHPGMEPAHLRTGRFIRTRNGSSVEKLRFVNQDMAKTDLPVEKLEDVLDFLRGKCYINVDKYWTDIPRITNAIRKCEVEKQVIVKTPTEKKYYKEIKEYASDFMYLPVVKNEDNITDELTAMGINCIGAEVCFDNVNAQVCSPEYISEMHSKGKVIFANAIVYDYKTQLAAGHSDDESIITGPDDGWGWLIDRGFDIIQTDWCGMVKEYMRNR